jgi:hypothetical protein
MKSIALFGQLAAGKTTIAAALVDAGYHRMSFAGPLKNVAALAYGTIDKAGEYDVVRPHIISSKMGDKQGYVPDKVSGREILQGIGQTVKAVDRDFWLKAFLRDAKNYLDQPLVVDDGRFLFEFAALKRDGWLTVGIDTPHAERMKRYKVLYGREPTKEEQEHDSEIEVPEIIKQCDVIVDGSDDAYVNVETILRFARG